MIFQKAIGVMSGTSLDGLDIAFCTFRYDHKWNFALEKAETVPYSSDWKKRLQNAPDLSGLQLHNLHNEYGRYIGKTLLDFIQKHHLKTDLIASHGHTVFHQPEKKLSLQIGNGGEIASETAITTISDFRNLDVALGGQGAPLVPIGDKLLFSEYDACINIGGFANISFQENKQNFAYDISPANIILNYLAQQLGAEFDNNGELGRQGVVNTNLLEELNHLEYYNQTYPKSLGKEWLDAIFMHVLSQSKLALNDILTTVYHHIAHQISKSIKKENSKVLITGGGAYNKFLIELIQQQTRANIIIPDKNIIDFKEALIFAFLGVLRYHKQINCLSSVTGARKDSSSGIVHIIP